MQTVQLQCGSCANMMAISVEHLGSQVRCPHCQAVVQTPPRSALGPPPGPDPQGAAVQPPQPQYQPPAPPPEHESIFSDPEPSDDLFGAETGPRVQMPEPDRAPAMQQSATALADDDEQTDLSALGRIRESRKASSIAPTILVFLVPYAICTTGFIAYLLLTYERPEAFKWLNEPNPKVGPVHDKPLPGKLKTSLKQPITVGTIEITPLKVAQTAGGDLTLSFKAKNLSDKTAYKPIDRSFFAWGTAPPYTFLDRASAGGPEERVYGGELAGVKELGPGQECVVELTTESALSTRKTVKALLARNEPLLWRIQVRRGTHPIQGVDKMITAVVGVEFSRTDVDDAG